MHRRVTAQELLLKAHQTGVNIRAKNGNLELAPARLITPKRLQAVREHKPELLALLQSLDQQGAQDDPIILEALALFDATVGAVAMPLDATLPQVKRGQPSQASSKQLSLGLAA
jgi:hypothetical protein